MFDPPKSSHLQAGQLKVLSGKAASSRSILHIFLLDCSYYDEHDYSYYDSITIRKKKVNYPIFAHEETADYGYIDVPWSPHFHKAGQTRLIDLAYPRNT